MGNDELSIYQKEFIFCSTIEKLKTLLKADPEAIRLLVHHCVPCNKAVETDTTMVPGINYATGNLTLSLMGIINGIIEPITGKRIAVVLPDADGQPILNFCKYDPSVRYE